MANATYSYSAISLRGRASLPSPSNHCSCYFLKEFVSDNTQLPLPLPLPLPLSLPLSSCCICSCSCSTLTSSTVTHLAGPINPSFSCALRQSTLLQLSAPRKLFSSAARHRRYYYYRLPVYGPDRGCCELSCAERKERGSLYRKVVTEAKSRRCGYRAVGDAEAALSLLTEGIEVKECGNGVGERVGRVRRKGRGGHAGTSECHGGEKELGLSGSSDFKSCEVENRREEREAFAFTGTSSVGRGSSTCSSVYFSSSEEYFHSNAEVQVNDQRESVGVSLEECGGDVGGNGVGRYNEIRKGEDEKCRDAAGVPSEQITGPTKSARARTNDWDWRKNSEKKLTDVVTDEQKGTVEMSYREPSNTENGSNAVYCSQNCHREDESNVEERARKQYAQIGIHGSGTSESRRKYKQHAQMQEMGGHKLRSTNIFQHKLNSGKENIGVTKNMSLESRKIHGQESNYISFQHELDRISHKNSTASEVHEQTSNLNWLSETLRKNQEKTATSVLDERTRNQGGQVAISESEVSESRKEYQQQHTEMQEASSHNLKLNSLSQQNNLSQEAISKTAPEDYYISCQHDSGRNSQQVLTASEVHERTSELNKCSETLRKKQEKNAALILNSNKERMEQQSHRTSQRFVKKIDSRRKFHQSTEVLNLEGMYIKHASSSQRQPDPMVSNREENLNLVFSSLSEAEQQCFQLDRQAIKRTIFRKGSQAGIKSHGISMGMNTEESYLAPVDGTRSQLDQTNRSALHIDPRIETQKPSKLSSLHEPTSSKAFGIQVPLDLEAQGQEKEIGLKEDGHRRSQTIMMPPQSQLVTRGGSENQECPRKVPGSGMRDPVPQGSKLDLQMELQDKSRRDTSGEPLKLLSHEDFMSKASHPDKSSIEFVGDYVENIESEVIASEIQGEQKVYKSNLVYRGEEHKQKGLGKHGPSNFHSKKSDSKHSSVDFGTKGPSTGMLDVVDPAFLEVSEGTATDKNSIVKRPSRSLWNIVRDVFRLQCGSNGDTHNFGGKFGAKSSSDESLCSEAWFSGLEPDKKNEEIMRRKPRVPTSSEQLQPTVTPGQSQRYSSDTRSSKDDETRYFEADIPSSSSVLQSRSGSRGKSPASGYESTDRSEDGKSLQGTSSTANHVLVESSILLPSKGTRSPVASEISDTEITAKMQQPVNTRLVKGLGTVGKDMGLSRSKLQRKDQVMKDTFDEWEEAYKMESKQRKIDEGFMREAILEAKKAADCWEVPVGAVLVQHGNVIARGCNLVEELRDSTAHAEMICIREASNVLRSWRLADTTLYVTLEPCPMCAGAILQARIKTVVWGTPNKLLGADGSWIRLFPDGGEAGNALAQTDKSAAPVHPFHPNMTVRRGVLAAECADAMQHFFKLRRRKKEKKLEPPTPLCPIVRHPSNFFSKLHHILHIIFCL